MAKKIAKKKKKKPAGRKSNTAWHTGFIKSLEMHGIVSVACRALKVPRNTLELHRKRFKKFDEECIEAIDASTGLLEREAIRRAYEGVEEPVYQGGELVGHKIKYSDTLLIFRLKALLPLKYRDNPKADVDDNSPVVINILNEPIVNKVKEIEDD